MSDVRGTGSAVVTTTVVGLQGRPVAATAPAVNQVLMWSGTQWMPGTVSGSTTPPPTGGGAISTPGGGAVDTPGGGAIDSPAGGAALRAQIAELEARIAALEGK